MTLRQMSQLKRWHVDHREHAPLEYHAWDGVLTLWLLGWMGVPDREIEMLNLESLRHRSIHGILSERQQAWNTLSDIRFEEFDDLPPFAELVAPEHELQWNYLRSRHVPEDFPVFTAVRNDNIHWTRAQVIIPFTYNNVMVGWTARMLTGKGPKYISHSQPGYV